jgi:nitrogen fixation NifU-like protein
MVQQYSSELIDHFKNPRNLGEMADADVSATVGNSVCGDVMTMFLKFDGNNIAKASFQSYGCGPCIALSSIVTEKITGMSIKEAYALDIKQFTDKYPEIPKNKKHCTGLVIVALKKAIDIYREEKRR